MKKESLIRLRNRGMATVAGISTYAISTSVAFAQTSAPTADSSSAETGLGTAVADDNRTAELFGDGSLFQTVVNILLFLVGAISVIMLIVGGIRYIVSAGDQNQVTSAKNTILYAIIGIIVAVLSWAIVNFILGFLYNRND